MKAFLFKSILMAIIFLGLNVLYLEILKTYDWNLSKVYRIHQFENKNYDYLFLGASLTLDGIDAKYLTDNGYNAYNFGTQGTSIRSSYIQLEHYLNNNKKPKYVILGIGSLSKSYKEYKEDKTIDIPYQYVYFENEITYKNLPLIKFRGSVIENLKLLVSKNHREANFVRGQLRIKKSVQDKSSYSEELDKTIHISDYQGASFLFKMDSLCRKKNIKFLVLEMPGFKKTQNLIPLGPHQLFDEHHDTLTLYNLNNKNIVSNLIDSEKDWLGNSHLNQYGAKKITKYIEKEILSKL